MTFTESGWVLAFGGLALVSLVPIVWAIVDVVRRPSWQFPIARKILWVVTLAVGWLILWPVALLSSLMYLFVLRKRLSAPVAKPSMPTWDPYAEAGTGRPPPLPAAGWYPDPAGRPGERWWDGRGWSEHLRPVPPSTPGASAR